MSITMQTHKGASIKGPVRLICPHCGSGNVGRDAKTSWNVEKQGWVLSGVLDSGYCDDCGEEVDTFDEILCEDK